MFLDLHLGNLAEPLTGRKWDPPTIQHEISRRLAYYRARGLQPSHRVFLLYGNRLEFFVDLMAVWMLGGCAIPIDARLTPFEVGTLAQAASPRFAIASDPPDKASAAALEAQQVTVLLTSEASAHSPSSSHPAMGNAFTLDQDALVLFTSGTTGQPKGVVHTHRSLRARWMGLRQSLDVKNFRRTLCLLPTHFGHGLICNCLFPWLSGQDLFVVPPFKTDLVMQLGALLDEHDITFMSSVPTVWRVALKTAKPPGKPTLQRVFCGSAPLTAFLWKEIQRWTGTNNVGNAYGITETGSWVAGTTVPNLVPEDGLIGVGWGSVIKILNTSSAEHAPTATAECAPGESGYVWLNTPALMKGYLGRDDLTNAVVSQGWFMTGDIGVLDDRGYLYLRGREREEINKGGMKIYPGDLNAVVERFEGALDVCTFAYDDALYGQNVGLAVVLKDPCNQSLRALHDWLAGHVAKHQMPARWYLLDDMPRTSRGKINRSQVAQKCAGLSPVDLRRVLGTQKPSE
ncbi:MAG TPA: class I adenylate-forming enzyme family protein [Verrucomicrobiae bacterium]|nr:class I adenylate-forming enzyme family protein [Verrucomicrobiae bacterium]